MSQVMRTFPANPADAASIIHGTRHSLAAEESTELPSKALMFKAGTPE